MRPSRRPLPSLRLLALAGAALLAAACGGEFSGSSSGGDSTPGNGFLDLSASAGGVEAFETTVYPMVRQYCATCHEGNGPGSPHFAQPNLQAAYQAVTSQGKVNLGNPPASRLVVKVGSLGHNCWSDCATDAAALAAAIQQWADLVDFGSGGVSVDGALASRSVAFSQGVVDTGSERYSGNLIALYEFKEGAGSVARDTSGVAPALDLSLQGGVSWLSSWGVAVDGGQLIAGPATSRKLYDHIGDPSTGTQQYTLEAWITPANIVQSGPARIVTYSRNTSERNFTLAQDEYIYNVRNRSIHPDAVNEGRNGQPDHRTRAADRDAQDRLQHVVLTYDQFRGRRIYVDGVFTGDVDELGPARLWNWDPAHFLVMGDERGGGRPWQGQLRMVAIYRQALTDPQIVQNFEAGVGERLLMRFDVSEWMGGGSSVEFVVSDFDAYSYLFCRPTLRTPSPNGSRIANIRIAVNGELAASGQGFETIDVAASGTKQELSRQCTVIPKGSAGDDSFTLVFEHLGGFQNVVVQDPVSPAPIPLDPDQRPVNGLRDFARLDRSFARLTGQDRSVAAATFGEIQQQLPPDPDVRSFVAAQQVAIAKLALDYCDALVEGPDRTAFFPGFAFGSPPDVALATPAQRDLAFDPLYDRMVGDVLAMQPTRLEVRAALDALADQLTAGCGGGACDATRTRTVVKGACAAVLASAAVSLH